MVYSAAHFLFKEKGCDLLKRALNLSIVLSQLLSGWSTTLAINYSITNGTCRVCVNDEN